MSSACSVDREGWSCPRVLNRMHSALSLRLRLLLYIIISFYVLCKMLLQSTHTWFKRTIRRAGLFRLRQHSSREIASGAVDIMTPVESGAVDILTLSSSPQALLRSARTIKAWIQAPGGPERSRRCDKGPRKWKYEPLVLWWLAFSFAGFFVFVDPPKVFKTKNTENSVTVESCGLPYYISQL